MGAVYGSSLSTPERALLIEFLLLIFGKFVAFWLVSPTFGIF